MNPKIEKYKEERAKLARRSESINARIEELDRKITELENTDIIGVVRETGLSAEQLAELMDSLKKNPIARIPERNTEKETDKDDEE